MPAGTSFARYVGGLFGALLSMFAGAQAVHLMYNPLQDIFDHKAEVRRKKLEILRKQLEEEEQSEIATKKTA